MGGNSYSSTDWEAHATATAAKPADKIFTATTLDPSLDPRHFKVRESCDSVNNPNSRAIILAADDTGSMGDIAINLITKGIGVVFDEIIKRRPCGDPHLMAMVFGDAYNRREVDPIQVSQFESDVTVAKQMEKFHIVGDGGGNGFESYELPGYIAATRTKIDCFLKRGLKGYLFTIGDEPPSPGVKKEHVQQWCGDTIEADIPFPALVEMVNRTYDWFHIIVAEGSHCQMAGVENVKKPWKTLLGERAIVIDQISDLPELIVSLIEVNEGARPDVVAASWSGDKSVAISTAIRGLSASNKTAERGVATL